MLIPVFGYSQSLKISDDMTVVHFNANWNDANKVDWVGDLSDCKIKHCDIATNTAAGTKYKIVVVPTIVIYSGGEEAARFQANIMMTMEATKKEVQNKIDEVIMDAF